MQIKATCLLEFQISAPATFIFLLRPRSCDNQWIIENEYRVSPPVPIREFTDFHGNLCQRLVAQAGTLRIETSVVAESLRTIYPSPQAQFIPVENLPKETLAYLYPSRYCESDRLSEMATSITAQSNTGYAQCGAISDHVRNIINYTPGQGKLYQSATEIIDQGHGVCRDMAHVGIALCRALSIPARLAVGYLEGLEPMDMHAWFEAYIGDRWYTFDPTQPTNEGTRIKIASGRDAADVALYNQFGPPIFPKKMEVTVQALQ